MSKRLDHEPALKVAYIENAQFDASKIINGWVDWFNVDRTTTVSDAINQAEAENLRNIKQPVMELIGKYAIEDQVDTEFILDLVATATVENMSPEAERLNIKSDVKELRARQLGQTTLILAA